MIASLLVVAMLRAAVVAAGPSGTVTPAAPAASAMPPLGTYTYSVQRSGSELGTSTVTIQRADIGLTVHEDQTLQGGYSYKIDEIFDASTLAPRAYTGVYGLGTSSTTVRVAVDASGATVTFDATSGTAPFPNPRGVKQTYIAEGTLMSGYVLLPAQLHATKASQFALVSPRSVVQMICTVDPHPSATRPVGVPANDVVLSITAKQSFDVWYDPATFVVHALSVPGQQVLITFKK